MLILALTGSIATGKSTVLAMFKQENIATISSDEIVHELYQNEAVSSLEKLFPSAIKNNKIDRKILSEILVKTPSLLGELEKIIHPLVRQKQREFIEKCKENNEKLIVLEIPLLFETNSNIAFDYVLITTCPDEILCQRALQRDGMNEQKLDIILANQMSQQDKILRADFIIDTSKSLSQSKREVKNIIDKLIG
ncbi:MAG: dephospho-CoA kinase [Devosiaceae bacterium]|nr:dephospho-CoA kinase [Devosiaceae bacterium]